MEDKYKYKYELSNIDWKFYFKNPNAILQDFVVLLKSESGEMRMKNYEMNLPMSDGPWNISNN